MMHLRINLSCNYGASKVLSLLETLVLISRREAGGDKTEITALVVIRRAIRGELHLDRRR